MKAKKPIKKKEVEIELPTPVVSTPIKNVQIGQLDVSFGQEDLNKLANKINEIIVHINAQ